MLRARWQSRQSSAICGRWLWTAVPLERGRQKRRRNRLEIFNPSACQSGALQRPSQSRLWRWEEAEERLRNCIRSPWKTNCTWSSAVRQTIRLIRRHRVWTIKVCYIQLWLVPTASRGLYNYYIRLTSGHLREDHQYAVFVYSRPTPVFGASCVRYIGDRRCFWFYSFNVLAWRYHSEGKLWFLIIFCIMF